MSFKTTPDFHLSTWKWITCTKSMSRFTILQFLIIPACRLRKKKFSALTDVRNNDWIHTIDWWQKWKRANGRLGEQIKLISSAEQEPLCIHTGGYRCGRQIYCWLHTVLENDLINILQTTAGHVGILDIHLNRCQLAHLLTPSRPVCGTTCSGGKSEALGE